MTTYVISPRAQADIDGIWDYTVERWNEDQAVRYIRALQEAIEPSRPTRNAGARANRSVPAIENMLPAHTSFSIARGRKE